MSTFLTQTLWIDADPHQVLAFAMTPERILDYYPEARDGGVFTPGETFWCRGRSAVSLFERLPEACADDRVTVRVTSSTASTEPTSVDALTASPLMVMVEDWIVAPSDGGTRLERRFRDLRTFGLARLLPMAWIVRRGVRREGPKVIAGWGAVARAS